MPERQRKKHTRPGAWGRINGYMMFANQERPKIVKAHPEYAFVDVGRALGAAWRALTQKSRDAYNAKAKKHNDSLKK
jgi:hypothetical protein